MGAERFGDIRLPADFQRLMAMIGERPKDPKAKAQELTDLRNAILASPDLNAWRQGIVPEAYRNPTGFGGTEPRDPYADYVRLPRETPQDSWIPGHYAALYDRIAADGKVYTFKEGSPAYTKVPSGYKALLAAIEQQYQRWTNTVMPDAGNWPEELGTETPTPSGNGRLTRSNPGTRIPVTLGSQQRPRRAGWLFVPPGSSPEDRQAAARYGGQIDRWVTEAYRALEGPDGKVPLPGGAFLIVNRKIGGDKFPDTFYVNPVKKEFLVIDRYTGLKQERYTPTGWDARSHNIKGEQYLQQPYSQELIKDGYKYMGYFVASRPRDLPPNKLH